MNWLIQWGGDGAVHRLGWTLLHFLWQGAVVAGAFAVAQAAMRRRSSNARYLAGGAALVVMLVAPVATFAILGVKPVASPGSTPVTERLPQSTARPPVFTAPANEPVVVVRREQPRPAEKIAVPEFAKQPVVTPPVATPAAKPWNSDQLMRWLVLAWLVGVWALSLRLLLGSLRVTRLKRRGQEPVDAAWLERLHRLKTALAISRPVALVKSVLVEVPTVVGWLRPVILLPAASLLRLTPEQLESIIAHELAHVRRHDYLVNLLQNALETVLFYHPAVWWISSCVRAEREICCDEIAVQLCGDRLTYAEALTTLEQSRATRLSLAVGADGGSLVERIRRLTGAPARASLLNQRRTGGLLAAGLLAVILAGVLHHPFGEARAQATFDSHTDTNGQIVIGKLLLPVDLTNAPHQARVTPNGKFMVYPDDQTTRASYTVGVSLYNNDGNPFNWGVHPPFAPVGIDGALRLGNVPPGTWWLVPEVSVYDDVTVVATASVRLVVPGTSNGQGKKPLDLGNIEVVRVHSPQTDEIAPRLEVTNALGESFKLADHRGQYVLLDLEPLVGTDRESAAVTATWNEFGGNKKFTVVTVQVPPLGQRVHPLDSDYQKRPWPVMRLNDPTLPWVQAALSLRASFGFTVAPTREEANPIEPAVFLIAPEGKFVSGVLQGDGIKAAVEKAMGGAPEGAPNGDKANPPAEWGEPVNGVSVRLSAAGAVYHSGDQHFFSFAVSNSGPGTVSLVENQIAGEFERDGVWYSWAAQPVVTPMQLGPGKKIDEVLISMSGMWRKDGKFMLMTGEGKHTYRFAVTAHRAGDNSVIRAISNPVEVESRPNPPSSQAGYQFVPADLPVIANLSGTVVDDETGATLDNFWVQEGFADPRSSTNIAWGLNFRGPVARGSRQGEFMVQGRKAGQAWRVLASGYLPQMVLTGPLVGPMPDTALVVHLKRGKEVRGVVVNDVGLPLADVQLAVARAPGRNYRPGMSDLGPPGDTFCVTDDTGHFVLRGLDDSVQQMSVTSADGHQSKTVAARPEAEIKIVLPKPASLAMRYDIPGDAPEAKFNLQLESDEIGMFQYAAPGVEATVPNGGRIVLTNLTPGTYEFSRVATLPNMSASYEQRTVVLESGQSQEVDLVRKTGSRVTGQITGLDGINLQSATLEVQARGGDPTDFLWSSPHYDVQAYPANFGKDGKFQTALLEPGNYTITVQAFEVEPAEISMRSGIRFPKLFGSTDVTIESAREPTPVKVELHPSETPTNNPSVVPRGTNGSSGMSEDRFGRIEGVVRVGTQVVTNETLLLQLASPINSDAQERRTITKNDGSYVFNHVPPGSWVVHRTHSMLDIFGAASVSVEAGKTSQLDLVGRGRPVIGRVTLPPEITAGLDQVILPPSHLYLRFADSTNFQEELKDMRELKVKLDGHGFSGQAELSTDGTFRAEDIPAGTYWLTAEVLGFPARGGAGWTMASTTLRFVVPDMSSASPLDLGTLEPVIIHTPQAGETAALFEIETTNAGTFKLADHRGQYVLLDFEPLTGRDKWDPNMASVWKSFGANRRFAMVTIEVPPTAASAVVMEQNTGGPIRKPKGWPLASLLRVPFYEQQPLRAGYGLECERSFVPGPNLPGIILVGPDGKIIARDLYGDGIKAAVAMALNSSLGSPRGPSSHNSSNGSSAIKASSPAVPNAVAVLAPAGNANGISLTIRCATNNLKVGDEIPIEFTVSNHGTKSFKYGYRDHGNGSRMFEYALTARTAAGTNVPDPFAGMSVNLFGTYPWDTRYLSPGESFTMTVALNLWAPIRAPGKYVVTAAYTLVVPNEGLTGQATSAPITISVKPRTEKEMDAYIAGLTKRIASLPPGHQEFWGIAPPPELDGLLQKLMFTCNPKAAPMLINTMFLPGASDNWQVDGLLYYVPRSDEVARAIVAAAESHEPSSNLQGLLYQYDCPKEVIKPLIAQWLAPESRQWPQGATLAQKYSDDAFTERLIAIAGGSGAVTNGVGYRELARETAIRALAFNRTDEGVKALKTLFADPDVHVCQAVADAVVSAYDPRDAPQGRPLRKEDFTMDDVRPAAVRLLAQTYQSSMLPSGLRLLEQFGDDTFMDRLIAIAMDPANEARGMAIGGLAMNRTDAGVKTLKALLNDPDDKIRGWVESNIRLAYTARGAARGRPLRPDDFAAKYQVSE